MAKRKAEAVMHCTVKEFLKVLALCARHIKGLIDNALLFTTPPNTSTALHTEHDKLANLIELAAKDPTQITARENETVVVFDMLKDGNLPYVKGIVMHDTG